MMPSLAFAGVYATSYPRSISTVSLALGFDPSSNCDRFWLYMYWITSTVAFAASMHVLICTVFISIYGQGFALRGPTGSMAKAVEGMVQEQEQIITAFVIAVVNVSLSLQTFCLARLRLFV
jgi:hypothetical protein